MKRILLLAALLSLAGQVSVFARASILTAAPSPPPTLPPAAVIVPGFGSVAARVGFSRTQPVGRPNPDQNVSVFSRDERVYSWVVVEFAPRPSEAPYATLARWLRDGVEIWAWRSSGRAQTGWTALWAWSNPPRPQGGHPPGAWAVEWAVNDTPVARGTFVIQ